MTQNEALLHASNRQAHKVTRLAIKRHSLESRWSEMHGSSQKRFLAKELYNTNIKLEHALDEYEEAERRARKEATA